MMITDTIAAISSPPGPAARGIIRLSGPDSWPLAMRMFEPLSATPPPRRWIPVILKPSRIPAGALFFRGPASFTGQDVVEIHIPGAVPLLRRILAALIAAGARSAGPGEFSSRAYINGKCDLTEAEGIAAAIAATNAIQLRAAQSLRDGRLHQWTLRQTGALADLLALVEAGIDFSDEPGVSFISAADLQGGIRGIQSQIQQLETSAVNWQSTAALPTALLIGPANAGKSSLINQLSRQDRAIVSHHAGTTRDPIAAVMHTSRGQIRLMDSAGLEDSDHDMYRAMDQLRRQVINQADVLVLVLDPPHISLAAEDLLAKAGASAGMAWLLVYNKSDLLPATSGVPERRMRVSALTGEGIAELREKIAAQCFAAAPMAAEYITLNQRHRAALDAASQHLARAAAAIGGDHLESAIELVAGDMRSALDELGGICGIVSNDEILGRIFGRFCIGK